MHREQKGATSNFLPSLPMVPSDRGRTLCNQPPSNALSLGVICFDQHHRAYTTVSKTSAEDGACLCVLVSVRAYARVRACVCVCKLGRMHCWLLDERAAAHPAPNSGLKMIWMELHRMHILATVPLYTELLIRAMCVDFPKSSDPPPIHTKM